MRSGLSRTSTAAYSRYTPVFGFVYSPSAAAGSTSLIRAQFVKFGTQVSIDSARDEALLDLWARAGLTHCFVGIETPNEDSLRETKKRQNMHIDLVEQVVEVLLAHPALMERPVVVKGDKVVLGRPPENVQALL